MKTQRRSRAKTPKAVSPYYAWLKKFEGKNIEIFAVTNDKTDCTYDGTLLFVDRNLVAIRETNMRSSKVHIFPIEEVREIVVPEDMFRVKSKVKIKEIA
jgi:hypothetical protein